MRTGLRYFPEQIAAQRVARLPSQVIEVDARINVPPRCILARRLHRLPQASGTEKTVIMLFPHRARRIASKLGDVERWPASPTLRGAILKLQFDPSVEMGSTHRPRKPGLALEDQLLLAGRDQRMNLVTLEQIAVAHASDFHEVELHPRSFTLAFRWRPTCTLVQEPPSGGPRSSNPSRRTAQIEALHIRTKDRHDSGERIAIVGAGATGTYVLDALLRSGVARDIVVFENSCALGPGLAYAEHLNAPHALSNIAGIEIPPLLESLNAWAVRQPPEKLEAWGIRACAGDDRAFFPRVALGAWLADQFAMIVAGSPVPISVQRRAEVVDVVAMPQGCRVDWRGTDGRIVQDQFDRLIVATGYGPIAADTMAAATRTGKAAATLGRSRQTERFGVLGSSLSAIDVVTAIATARGRFVPRGDGMTYVAETPWRATLLSRNGLLPEADYWFPHPLPALEGFTPDSATASLRGDDGDLDRLFDQFVAVLRTGAPDWATGLGLADATADDFADRYFAARTSGNAWDHARQNLADVRNWHAHHDTPFWRIAILKAHEVFATVIPSLSKTDLARFHRGLKRVFTDNYAAVPHLSIERVLALRDAGHLEAQALGEAYDIAPQPDGTCVVRCPSWTGTFDELLDARGSQTAALNHFPFPTLRLQLCASALEADQAWSSGLNPAGDLTMRAQDTSLERVHLCALPFLLGSRPFVQGLVECAAMATAISGAIQEARGSTDTDPISAADLLEVLERPSIVLPDGAVLALAGSRR